MRDTAMWKEIIAETESDIKANKAQYEDLIKEYLK